MLTIRRLPWAFASRPPNTRVKLTGLRPAAYAQAVMRKGMNLVSKINL